MFDDHDIYILQENRFEVFLVSAGEINWSMNTTSNIRSIVAKFDDMYLVKVCVEATEIDTRICLVNTIEKAILKAKEIREAIESNWLNGGI